MNTSDSPALPAGLVTRPLSREDSRAVYELMAAVQLDDLGTVEIEEADIISDWARPSHDVTASSMAVLDGDTMVGYAELIAPERYDAAVLPSHQGRGIGTWLAAWIRDLARSRGAQIVGMPVPEGSTGDRLLTALGYHVRWDSWVLALPEGASIPDRPLPLGYSVGEARPDDYPAFHDVLEDAFLEWSRREREPYDDFTASVMGRPGFEPWQLRAVRDAAGAVVGAAITIMSDSNGMTGYVDRLAVRSDQRNRGLAQVLLVDAFARAREHGADTCELSTDSRTGALGLYQKVGMVVTANWRHRAASL